jgi:hypothetical protein
MAIRRNGILNSNLKNQRALVDAIVAAIIKGVPVSTENRNAAQKVNAKVAAGPLVSAMVKRANSNKLVKTFTADQLAMAIVLAIKRGLVPTAVTEKLVKTLAPNANANSRIITDIIVDAIKHKEPVENSVADGTNLNQGLVSLIAKPFKRALAFFRIGNRPNLPNNDVERRVARASSYNFDRKLAELMALLKGPLSESNRNRVIAAIVAALRAPARDLNEKMRRLFDAKRDLGDLAVREPRIRDEFVIQERRAKANAVRARFSWSGPGRPPINNNYGRSRAGALWPGFDGRSRGVPFWPEPPRRSSNNGSARRYTPMGPLPPQGPMGPFGPAPPAPRPRPRGATTPPRGPSLHSSPKRGRAGGRLEAGTPRRTYPRTRARRSRTLAA